MVETEQAGLADLDLAMLLCTRLCHDLAGPVGAVSAGAELLADESDPAFAAEATQLLRYSADAAAGRLNVLRAAFGVSGRIAGTGTAKAMATAYLAAVAGDALRLTWHEDAPALGEVPEAAQLVLNLVLVAVEAAHGAGNLGVSISQADGRIVSSVTVEGRRTVLSGEARAALDGVSHDLTARTVQFYWTHRLAAPHGGLDVGGGEGRLTLGASHPIRTI